MLRHWPWERRVRAPPAGRCLILICWESACATFPGPVAITVAMGKSKGRRTNKTGRSSGARFIQLEYWILECPAFLALSANAKIVLLFMLKRYDGNNNGKIGFGVRSGCFVPKQGTGELVDRPIGISRSNKHRALNELNAAGFIRCTQPATFDQKRLTREWRLTWLPCNGQLPTKDFVPQPATEKAEPSPANGTIEPTTVPQAGQ